MINVGIVTTTRAEYGLLKPIYFEFCKHKNVNVKLIVSGTHLSKKYGYTIDDITSDNVKVDKKICIINDDKSDSTAEIFSKAIVEFDKYLKKSNFDTIVLLGDRYETLAFATACLFNNIPICHLYGGETTEGAIDEAIRHSITKMSFLHFTSCDEYRNRVIQLGEDPKRVFTVGSVGVENVLNTKLYNKSDASKLIDYNLNDYFVVTYHPVTLKSDNNKDFHNLLNALNKYNNYQIVFTKTNADKGGMEINKLIDKYVQNHNNAKAYYSLGTKLYLSLVKYSKAVIGNSSSGLSEAPALCVPTVNIGDRQKGRIRVKSVIDCNTSVTEIKKAIDKAILYNGKISISDLPFYRKNTSKNIVKNIVKNIGRPIDLMKRFYNLEIV